jgi:enterochelin esterase-like enzyme
MRRSDRYPVLYVLPVEIQNEREYGDGLREARNHDLANRYRAILVSPTFSQLPWYADHPSDLLNRQETYLLQAVIPFVERTYPVIAERRGRLLLGFSKAGCGAWSLLLRHPEVFVRAAAWDAPLMMEWPPGYPGAMEVFATRENFQRYEIQRLIREQAPALRLRCRLLLAGYGNFRADHEQMHALLEELHIPHGFYDGPERGHDWNSGWVSETVAWLLSH